MQKVGDDYFIYSYEISEIGIIHNDEGVETKELVGTTEKSGFKGESNHYLVNWTKDQSGNWIITNQEKPAEFSFTKEWYDGNERPPVC